MESLKEYLRPERFTKGGFGIAISCLGAGVISAAFMPQMSRSAERQEFQCASRSDISVDQDFMKAKCYGQYDQIYNPVFLSLHELATVSFFILVLVSVMYQLCSCACGLTWRISRHHRVGNQPDPSNPPGRTSTRTLGPFFSYIIHLLARLSLGVSSAMILYFKTFYFPSEFRCKWDLSQYSGMNSNITHFNSSSMVIFCHNSIAKEKTSWALAIFSLHIALASLVFCEIIYLVVKACGSRDYVYNFLKRRENVPENPMPMTGESTNDNGGREYVDEDKFLRNYKNQIILQTETLEGLPLDTVEPKTDDIYIDLVISSKPLSHFDFPNNLKNRHQIFDVYLKKPQDAVNIDNVQKLFLPIPSPTEGLAVPCSKIVIVGRPGIGKSSLCTKLLREWAKNEKLLPDTKYAFLFRFRGLNSDAMTKSSLKELLSRADYSSKALDDSNWQSITDHPDNTLIIFDGLDEYTHRNTLLRDELRYSAYNRVTDEIPVSAIYVKLLKGKLLNGAKIVTTTRPHELKSYYSIKDSRVVEILGFTKEKVESYVQGFYRNDPSTTNRVWRHIDNNINLQYLCYIPLICRIVCYTLKRMINSNVGQLSIFLPTTLTTIYQEALIMFINKLHPEYREGASQDYHYENNFSPSVKETLNKLESLARKGITEGKLIFNKTEVQEIEECGLLNCTGKTRGPPAGLKRSPDHEYCFLHITMQEFLAARDIMKMKPKEIVQFIEKNCSNSSWYLVIQFIAGSLQGNVDVTHWFGKNYSNHLSTRATNSDTKSLTLLLIKCLSELRDESVIKEANSKVKLNRARFNDDIAVDLSDCAITPLDCTSIVYCLKPGFEIQLDTLDLSYNVSIGEVGCSELTLLIKMGCPKSLKMSSSRITADCLKALRDGITNLGNSLESLDLANNELRDEGVSCLCLALENKKCKLTKLCLGNTQITSLGASHLSNVMVHSNCQLTRLYLEHNDIGDTGVSYLCNAIKHVDCKLIVLELKGNKITNDGVRGKNGLCVAITENKKCRLKMLGLAENVDLTDEIVSDVYEVLNSKNNKLTNVDLGSLIYRHGTAKNFMHEYLWEHRPKRSITDY